MIKGVACAITLAVLAFSGIETASAGCVNVRGAVNPCPAYAVESEGPRHVIRRHRAPRTHVYREQVRRGPYELTLCISHRKWQEIASRPNPGDRCWWASTSSGKQSNRFFSRCGVIAGKPGEVYSYFERDSYGGILRKHITRF